MGVDPGTTSGVAIISLEGNLISVKSKKGFGRDKIIKYIMSYGSPTIIATDKKKAPATNRKIAASLDSKLFTPKEDLLRSEKLNLIQEYDLDDSHQRDALASALNAYQFFEGRFKKIDKNLTGNLKKFAPEIKDLLVKGKIKNIKKGIEKFSERELPKNKKS